VKRATTERSERDKRREETRLSEGDKRRAEREERSQRSDERSQRSDERSQRSTREHTKDQAPMTKEFREYHSEHREPQRTAVGRDEKPAKVSRTRDRRGDTHERQSDTHNRRNDTHDDDERSDKKSRDHPGSKQSVRSDEKSNRSADVVDESSTVDAKMGSVDKHDKNTSASTRQRLRYKVRPLCQWSPFHVGGLYVCVGVLLICLQAAASCKHSLLSVDVDVCMCVFLHV